MIPKNRPSERSLSPNSDAPWRVSNPMGTVSGLRPQMFFLLLQAVGWMVLWNLWPYNKSSSYIVDVDFHSGGVRILGGGTSCGCHVSGCGHVSWPWFHWSCQLQFFEFHELDHSLDIMKRIWRKGINKAMISGLLSKWCITQTGHQNEPEIKTYMVNWCLLIPRLWMLLVTYVWRERVSTSKACQNGCIIKQTAECMRSQDCGSKSFCSTLWKILRIWECAALESSFLWRLSESMNSNF